MFFLIFDANLASNIPGTPLKRRGPKFCVGWWSAHLHSSHMDPIGGKTAPMLFASFTRKANSNWICGFSQCFLQVSREKRIQNWILGLFPMLFANFPRKANSKLDCWTSLNAFCKFPEKSEFKVGFLDFSYDFFVSFPRKN